MIKSLCFLEHAWHHRLSTRVSVSTFISPRGRAGFHICPQLLALQKEKSDTPMGITDYSAVQRRTVVTTHLKSKQLLLFAFVCSMTWDGCHCALTPPQRSVLTRKQETLGQCWFDVRPASKTLAQHQHHHTEVNYSRLTLLQ